MEVQVDTSREEEKKEIRNEEDMNKTSMMQLSLNAFNGVVGPKVMRLKGYHEKRPLFILINSSSTHNFLSETTINK